jgi:hypothetical protein
MGDLVSRDDRENNGTGCDHDRHTVTLSQQQAAGREGDGAASGFGIDKN